MNVSSAAGLKSPMIESSNRGVIQKLIPSALLHFSGDDPASLLVDMHQNNAVACGMMSLAINGILWRRCVDR